ncbi:uncharacterized protein BX664DRAFT_283535 [Halteromyces radiatus]|uniref:uncharacterized protein n=1 Tax=Halteromyces radiatus TaxID=101107 RepID=UPI00221E652B|nr:uncharacterized protein BX664DRAFT_283535 [Halteromyces radiatus]KAI8084768.1 hypothetical protein BX664DRAFT_283535 [Halteromyces radiatus]
MGCCISTEATIHEVVFDEKGVAKRVPKGQGTHLIHVYQDQETNIEKKVRPPGIVLPSEYNKQHNHRLSSISKPETAYYPKPPRKMTITRPSATSKRSIQPMNDNN